MQRPPTGEFDAIVIGSGIGGLVTAALLAREGGQRVLVLERHYRVGGFTHVFSRPGYEWDVGVHYVGRVGKGELLRALFDRVTDGKLEWVSLPEVYDSIELGPRRYELRTGREAFVSTLAAYFPARRSALEQYARLVTSTARKVQLELINRVARPNAALLSTHRLAPSVPMWAQKTTRQTLEELGFGPLELAVLCGQYGDYGPPPARSSFALHAAVADHYLEGAYYPLDGSSQFAHHIAPLIEAAGGHLATRAEVKRIVVEGNRVTGVELSDGRALKAKTVISDAGARATYTSLLPEAHRPAEVLEGLSRATTSSGHLCLYLGMRHTDAELGLTGTNLWLHPSEHFDETMERYEQDPSAPFPMLYLSFPSAKDPDFQRRHPGRSTLECVTMARWEWFERWAGTDWQKRGADYEAFKQSLQQRLLDAVLQRLPQLKGKIDHVELSTPLSTAHFAGHSRGELYGIEGTPARYRVPLRAQTHLEGLFLTGADLATAGVAGAAFAGALSAAAILGAKHLWDWFPLEHNATRG